jgi:hypothetical protein
MRNCLVLGVMGSIDRVASVADENTASPRQSRQCLKTMTDGYIVEAASILMHAPAVLSLWQRGLADLSGDRAERKLQQGYVNNPAGSGVCLQLRSTNMDDLLGVQCLLARDYYVGERHVRVAAMADYVVADKHRTLGPALKLMKRAIEEGRHQFDLLIGFPNEKSLAVSIRAGLREAGRLVRYGKPLHSRLLLQRKMPPALARLLSWPLDLAIAAWDFARPLRWSGGLTWHPTTTDDPALDQIWQSRPDHLMLAERSARALSWRYADDPLPVEVWIARDRQGQPAGYMLCSKKGEAVVLRDFLCVDPEQRAGALLASFCWHIRRHRAAAVSIEFAGAQAIHAAIINAGFIAKAETLPVTAVNATQRTPAPAHWYMTSFDRDQD